MPTNRPTNLVNSMVKFLRKKRKKIIPTGCLFNNCGIKNYSGTPCICLYDYWILLMHKTPAALILHILPLLVLHTHN